MATLSPRRATPRFAGLLALVCLACLMAPARVAADDVAVTDQSGFETAVESALQSSGSTSIIASGGSAFVAGSDWVLPGDAASLAITFNTSPFQIGNADGDASLTLQSGSSLVLNTTSGSSMGRIEIGNGGTGALTLDGGTIQVNLADTSTTPGTSIGRIWVGGGSTNTTGGTGTLTIISGELLYSANAGSLNYGGLAVGRGGGVTGTLDQSGGTVRFDSAGALDLGTQGGTGSYTLSGDAVFDAGSGGLTAYIGSRTAGAGGSGTAATGTLTISDTATFTMTTGDFAGGQLYVGDSKGTGTITQDGAGSSVTLTLANPIRFGSDVSNVGTGGTGTYNLSAGTLTIGSGGGSSQVIFGAASGGTGTFNISGGSADIAAPLVLASVEGASGTVNMTGGALTLSGSSYLSFGSGTGTFNLDGGTLTVGGSSGIRGTGTFNFGAGTLQVIGSALTTSVNATLVTGTTSTIDTNGFDATWSGNILGLGALTKTGSGTLILTKSNSYGGGTTISGGTVEISLLNGIGTGGVTFDGGTLATTATLTAARTIALTGSGTLKPSNSTTLTWSGVISGDGGLTKSGGGTLVLSGTNTYTGGTTIAAGTLSFTSDANLGDSSGGITLSGGALATGTSTWTSSRDITINSASTLTTNASTTLSGSISGTGGLTKTGTSSLTLSGDMSSYSGAVTLSAGTIRINTTSFSSDVATSTTLAFISDSDISYAGTVSGTGTLSKSGTGTLTLTGNNTNTGTTTVSAGILQISADTNLGSGTLNLNKGTLATTASFESSRAVSLAIGGGTFSTSDETTLTLYGVVSGSGRLTKTGDGTLVLTGTNTYTGNTTISAGILQVEADANLGGTGSLTFNGGTLATTETFSSARVVTLSGAGTFATTTGTSLSLSGVLSGSGSLTKTGAGTLILSGTNTFSGDTTIAAGTLSISADANLGNTDSAVILDGGTLKTTQSFTSSRRYAFDQDGVFDVATGTTLTLSSVLEGDGALVLTGAGTLVIDQEASYWGGTVLSGGTLVVSDHVNLGEDSGAITFDGGTLHAAESFETGRSVFLTSDGTISTGSGKTLTLSGTLSGTGDLTMAGPGTLVLSGTNTYTGDTIVASGTLDLSGSLAGAVQVAGGATLTGSGTIDGTVTVGEDARLSGAQGSGLTMGALVLEAGSNLEVSLGATSAGGVFTVTGDLTLDGTLHVNQLTDFGAGVYTIITYGGVLTDNGLEIASLDNGYLSGVQTAQAGEVNLVVQSGDDTIQFWNGGNSSATDGVLGGTGNWKLEDNNWTDSTGTIAQAWSGGFAVFQGTGGVVTIDNGNGDVTTAGMQFATAGYEVKGDAITLTGDGTIRVGDGTANGAYILAAFWNTIQGEAGLNKTDLGQLMLLGENTYTGGTTISGGTLIVNQDSALGEASGGITINGGMLQSAATFETERAVTLIGTGQVAAQDRTVLTLSGEISGAGALDIFSVGDVILTGDNSYTGGTIVSFGKLKIGKDAAFGDEDGGLTIYRGTLAATATFTSERDISLTGDAKIETEAGTTLTLAGVISSGSVDGRLTKTGTGTLILSGDNTYTGTTTISAGTLQVGADAALGYGTAGLSIGAATLATTGTFTTSRTVSLTAAATVDTAEDTSLTLSGLISGSGSLTKAGAGTLILTADNTYTGTTTISAGTLQIGDGGTTGSITGDIVNNASLVFNRSGAYTIAGSITGTGTLTLSGGGTATFASSVAGDVTLEDAAAVLALDSVTTADFIVGDGGVLSGTATIGSLTVNDGGTVAPGYSPGILTVTGPVTFNAGSVYAVDVTPDGSHDQIIASGDVTLSTDAHVEVLASGGVYDRNSRLTILTTTATLTGEFGGVTSNFAFLLPTLDYDAQNVYLDLVYTGADIDGFARTSNQVSVAHAIQALGDGNDLFDAITLLSEDAVAPALDQLSGEIYPSINTVISQQGGYLRDAVGARLRQSGAGALGAAARSAGPVTATLDRDPSSVFWMQGLGAWDKTLGNGNAATITASAGGLYIGADAALTDTLRAGFVAGYSGSRLSVDDRASSGNMESAALGAYVGAQFGALGLQGGVAYGWHGIDVTRSIVFPGFADQQSATYGVGALQLFGEASYRLAVAGFEVEPFANLAYVNLSGGSARETGLGAAGLTIDVAGQQTLYTTLGTRLATTIALEGATITPSLSLGWQHAFGDTATSATMQSGSTPFSVEGVPIATDSLMLGAGVAYDLSDALSLELNYAGKFAAGANQNAVTARLSGRF